jgi:hypothetical protein
MGKDFFGADTGVEATSSGSSGASLRLKFGTVMSD